ncbi:MAG: alpha-amylase family glycosyl hydrolase, partial [Bacteroidota bacterium]
WLNPDAKHPFNVGYDFNHESSYTKSFVKQVSRYWIEEYHIDGFRFDLSKGFTQSNNPNDVGAWSRRDASRIAILKEYGDFIWNIDPNSLLILEHFADNNEEKELAEYGFMLWGNHNHNFNEATMGYLSNSNFSGVIPAVRGWSEPYLVGFMESHDEERLMYKNLEFGNANGDYSVKDFSTAIDRQRLANTFYWLIPGPKMIWQFGELGYEFSINRCQNGSVTENCRLDKKPIRWDYFQNDDRRSLYFHIQTMTALRDSLELGDANVTKQSLAGAIKRLELVKDQTTLLAVGNFAVTDQSTSIDFPADGLWYELFSGDSVMVENGAALAMDFAPGDFMLYANQNIELTTSVNELTGVAVAVFPNPSQGTIHITSNSDVDIYRVALF